MRKKSLTNKLQILKYLLEMKVRLTASQIAVSNANQFLIPLEHMKLIKRHTINNSRCKFAYIDNDTRLKVKDYLAKHNELNTPTPLHIVNNSYVEDFESKGSN